MIEFFQNPREFMKKSGKIHENLVTENIKLVYIN